MRARSIILAVLALWSVGSVCAQTFPFQLLVQQGTSVFPVENNTTVTFASAASGAATTIRVSVVYQGQTEVTLPSSPTLTGSSDFAVSSNAVFPLTLRPNDVATFNVTYTPAFGAGSVQFRMNYSETGGASGSIALLFVTGTPSITVSYALQTDGNVISLPTGGKISFPGTLVNTTTTATVIVSNRGTAPASINSISVTGSAFQPAGLPLLPGTLQSSSNFSFLVRFSPKDISPQTGGLEIDIGGNVFKVSLEGSAIGSTFRYEIIESAGPKEIQPNQEVSIADTAVGKNTNLLIQVRNLGNADGVISALGISGPGFALTDLPFLPATVPPNDFLTFSVVFAPTQPGRATGRLRIGNSIFNLTANAIGPLLTFSYLIGSEVTPIQPGGIVLFSPVEVGKTASVSFSARNEGTSLATIAAVALNDTKTVFRLENLPGFPFALQPGEGFTFSIVFAPNATGPLTSSLIINAQSFGLSGFGTSPPPLRSYQFTGASGTLPPFQQPTIGLSISEPYPIPLVGILTMTVNSDSAPPDPAAQFTTGGRQIGFTIPANSLKAVFPSGGETARFQTGTVAGAISFKPLFATTGGLELKPDVDQPLQVTVSKLPPTLLTARTTNQTADSFILEVVGFTTTRSLSKLDFTFTATSDVNLSGNQFRTNVAIETSLWFGGTPSQSFGGQFTVSIPFVIRGQINGGATLLSKIRTVTVTGTNELGDSNSVTATLP